MTSSNKSEAIKILSPLFAKELSSTSKISNNEYSISLPYATARLPGIVHGVVVQIIISWPVKLLFGDFRIGNLANIVVLM